MHAARNGRLGVAKLLINHKAHAHLKTENGCDAFHVTAMHDQVH